MEPTGNIEELLREASGWDSIEAQHDRFRRSYWPHQEWSRIATECVDFFEGRQWTEEEKRILREEGRPKITKNKVAPLMRLMFGFFRQNKYELKYLPGTDGSADEEAARTITAVAKAIAERNQSEWNDAQVFQDGILTGRGFWDIRMDFDNNMMGDVKERICDPFSILIDPEAEEYDPSSWGYTMESRWLSPVEIFQLYGEQALDSVMSEGKAFPITGGGFVGNFMGEERPPTGFGLDDFWKRNSYDGESWTLSPFTHINRNRKIVRVLDCQWRKLKRVNFFVDLETGAEKVVPDSMDPAKIQRIMQYAQARNLPLDARTGLKKVVHWTTTAGDQVLWDKESPYDDFTTIPYFPYFRRGMTKSPIEDLLDPQREINKRASAFLHIIMTTANSGWIWEKGALDEDMERAIEEQGARPGLNLVHEKGSNAPQKIQPSATPMAMKQLEADANADIKDIAGINDSALGQLDRVQSGRAIQARQKQAVVGAETYFDNFSRSRELKGRRVLSLIQTFYTEQRIVRTRGDGTPDQNIIINRRTAAGEIENNVMIGNYQVAIDESPISASFMQAQLQEAIELRQLGVPIPDDIMVKLTSMPMKEEVVRRLVEQYQLTMDQAKTAAMGAHMQLGLPPGMPVPPVAVTPETVTVQQNTPVPPLPQAASPIAAPGAGVPQYTGVPPIAAPMPANQPAANNLRQPTMQEI